MLFRAPEFLNETTFPIPSVEDLQSGTNGLHRAGMEEVYSHFPGMAPIILKAPVYDLDDYEIDIKVHMLMARQFPCIPNWHCDNVPRFDGALDYEAVDLPDLPKMFMWVSDAPLTQFLGLGVNFYDVASHGELTKNINDWMVFSGAAYLRSIPKQTWTAFDQSTPHRGMPATEAGWRIFVRLTPKEIVTARPVVSKIRRHSQVYLPHNFHW